MLFTCTQLKELWPRVYVIIRIVKLNKACNVHSQTLLHMCHEITFKMPQFKVVYYAVALSNIQRVGKMVKNKGQYHGWCPVLQRPLWNKLQATTRYIYKS